MPRQSFSAVGTAVDEIDIDMRLYMRYYENTSQESKEKKSMNTPVTQLQLEKTLQEGFKSFGEDLLKIFPTRVEIKEELKKHLTRDEFYKEMFKLHNDNDVIIAKLTKMEQEQIFGVHRMDTINVKFDNHEERIVKLEDKVL